MARDDLDASIALDAAFDDSDETRAHSAAMDDLAAYIRDDTHHERGNDMDEQAIENAVRQKGLTAPRLTPDDIDALIVGEQYHRFEGTTVTVCCLHLRNGYCVIGESAAVSMENFDAEIGRGVARSEARNKIWALAGYALKQQLYEQAGDSAVRLP